MSSEAEEEAVVYLVVSGIPSELRSAQLRSYFSQFREQRDVVASSVSITGIGLSGPLPRLLPTLPQLLSARVLPRLHSTMPVLSQLRTLTPPGPAPAAVLSLYGGPLKPRGFSACTRALPVAGFSGDLVTWSLFHLQTSGYLLRHQVPVGKRLGLGLQALEQRHLPEE